MKKRLTKLQKRMLVLKDALKQIKIGFLRPEHDGVCTIPGYDHTKKGAKELLASLKRNKKHCKVCARGSLLLACVGRFNKFSVTELQYVEDYSGSFEYDSPTDVRLKTLFTDDQLMMMETAFEGAHNRSDLGDNLHDKCVEFADRYDAPKARLIAILENAIKNKGTFIP